MVAKKDSPKFTPGMTIRVATKEYERRTQREELELEGLGEEDVKSLRKSDPFMYYSIPSIRRAVIFLRGIDHSNKNDLYGSQVHSDRNSAPANPSTIPRRRAISFEAHPSVLLEDILEDLWNDDTY